MAGEGADFNGTGFALVMIAAAISGMRWVLTQRMLQRRAVLAGDNPLSAVRRIMPVMSAFLAASSLLTERLWATLPASPYCDTLPHTLRTAAILGAPP